MSSHGELHISSDAPCGESAQCGFDLLESDESSFAKQRIRIVTERLTAFANEIRDNNNEDDTFYQTIYLIYIFFGRRHSFLSILNAIHISAGDVGKAVHLLKNGSVSESQCFDFREILVSDERRIKRYMQIKDE